MQEVSLPVLSDPANARIFNESLFCDFKIETNDGEVLDAHKSFLAGHSPVFKAMFQHDTEESRNSRVKLEDINGKAMKEVLRYIYTGVLKNGKEVAKDVLVAADKYQIDGLKTRCCEILVKEVTSENAAKMIKIADDVQNETLFQRCMEFISW